MAKSHEEHKADMLDELKGIANNQIAEHGSTYPVVCSVIDGAWIASPILDSGRDTGDALAATQQALARTGKCTLLATMCEAWSSKQSPDQEPVRASKAENREEIVIITLGDKKGDQQYWSPILRDADGKASLGPWAEIDADHVTGRLVGVLAGTNGYRPKHELAGFTVATNDDVPDENRGNASDEELDRLLAEAGKRPEETPWWEVDSPSKDA